MDAGTIRYAQNGDVSIAYRSFGEGELDVLFVPGFIGHLEIGLESPLARRFFERLASFCRVHVFDKRGFGLSDREVDGYTLEATAEDAAAVLDTAGVERAAVFGVSEGGPAAAMFAATHPERTTALVEFGAYARLAEAPDYPQGVPVEVIRAFQRSLLEGWGTANSLRGFTSEEEARDPQLQEWWARLLRGGASPRTVRALIDAYERIDVRPVLPLVKAPTLVLWRERDRLIPPRLSKTLVEGIPDARGVELKGRPHLSWSATQDALLGEVEQFSDRGMPRAPSTDRCSPPCSSPTSVDSTARAATSRDSTAGASAAA
jgi:pimeloyl-ACP methyl ester carboxylesterase